MSNKPDTPLQRAFDAGDVREFWRLMYESATNTYKFMSRPGVSFTPEQDALIRQLIADDNIVEAQRVILDNLKAEFGE